MSMMLPTIDGAGSLRPYPAGAQQGEQERRGDLVFNDWLDLFPDSEPSHPLMS